MSDQNTLAIYLKENCSDYLSQINLNNSLFFSSYSDFNQNDLSSQRVLSFNISN